MDKFNESDNLTDEELGLSDEEIIEYDKYMVIANKGLYEEEVYGVYENELDAHRRLREVKMKNKTIIKANINYTYIHNVKFIMDYEEIQVIKW